MKPLCIYHANCADGFGAAWVVRAYFGEDNVEFHPGVYGEAPPDVTDRDVIIVDFSYKGPVIDELVMAANTLLVLDHHKSAQDGLAGLPKAREDWGSHFSYSGAPGCPHVGVLFDMERSGAGMAWDYFFPNIGRPKLIDHIEDRDLWRFKLPHTRAISAALFSYPYDFDVWDELMRSSFFEEETTLARLAKDGEAIERKHHKDVADLVEATKRRMVIAGISVPVANLPYIYSSDAGHLMAEGEPFAACYWDTPDGRVFSLRSQDDGADVSSVAVQYGGGGHARAAGFRMPIGWEGE